MDIIRVSRIWNAPTSRVRPDHDSLYGIKCSVYVYLEKKKSQYSWVSERRLISKEDEEKKGRKKSWKHNSFANDWKIVNFLTKKHISYDDE